MKKESRVGELKGNASLIETRIIWVAGNFGNLLIYRR